MNSYLYNFIDFLSNRIVKERWSLEKSKKIYIERE